MTNRFKKIMNAECCRVLKALSQRTHRQMNEKSKRNYYCFESDPSMPYTRPRLWYLLYSLLVLYCSSLVIFNSLPFSQPSLQPAFFSVQRTALSSAYQKYQNRINKTFITSKKLVLCYFVCPPSTDNFVILQLEMGFWSFNERIKDDEVLR